MRTVNFYRTESGKSPVEDFLDSLSGKQAQKVIWVLRLVEELDVVPRQYLKNWSILTIFGKSEYSSEVTFFGCSVFLMG